MAKQVQSRNKTTHIDQPHESSAVPCCPQFEPCEQCDTLDFRYRLPVRTPVSERRQVVSVEVILHFRLTRCPKGLSIGDLVYTTTIFPGESVRLFTSDRHSRFTFDTASKLAYRHETTSEESYYAAGMAAAMSDLTVLESGVRASNFHESSISGGGGAGIDLGIIEIGGSASGSSYDASSIATFANQLHQHAESSSRHVEVATRAASSVSMGEVQSRTHTQGESEDHFESSSRTFSNKNRCHAVTYFFYRINKCQTLVFELVGIERRVDDPAAPTGISISNLGPTGAVSVIPRPVLATAADRLEVERRDRTSTVERLAVDTTGRFNTAAAAEPIPAALRAAALAQIDKALVAEGLLDKVGGTATARAKEALRWERVITLPTPGLFVRGCLDECDTCEPTLEREIELELERKALENELLKRQIELLDKSQEYRCCPQGEAEETDES